MSVLKTLKGTILNVQQDISSGFRSLRSPEAKEKLFPEINTKVEHHAGSDLLNRYQDYWGEIHQLSEGNAKAAQTVDGYVNDIYIHIERQNEAMNQFLAEAIHIPALVTEVKEVMNKIGNIEMLFSDISSALTELEDMCDRQELSRNMTHHKHQLSLYQQKKDLELEQVKVSKAIDHVRKVESYESKLQGMLREKQEGLEAAYKLEIEQYKHYGQTQFKPSPKHSRAADLADIDLDTNTADLDAFLSTEETSVATDNSNEQPSSGENTATATDADDGKGDTSSEEEADAQLLVAVVEDSPELNT